MCEKTAVLLYNDNIHTYIHNFYIYIYTYIYI